MQEIPSPRIFISYSWTTPDHENWVLDLATRLYANDGVEVTIDKWDLKDGQEIYKFMESMVKADEEGGDIIDKVLLICDKGYQEKADSGKGGAGVEAQIVSPKIYNDIKQEKFIPIVAEKNDDGKPYLPTYALGRKYIDMSSEEVFEESYELLLRNLYKRPQHSKPKKGTPPSWLFDDKVSNFKIKNLNKQLRNAIDRNPERLQGLVDQFKVSYFELLDEFQISADEIKNQEKPLDDIVYDQIQEILPLKEDFVEFTETLCLCEKSIYLEQLVEFFEEILKFSQPPAEMMEWQKPQFDHYKFFIHELFLTLITVLLDKKRYDIVAELLNREYYFNDRFHGLRNEPFDLFYFHIESLDEIRKRRLKVNLLSISANLLVQRTSKKYTKEKLTQADLLLHHVSKMDEGLDSLFAWFPKTYPYSRHNSMELFQRLRSKRHFDRTKVIFNVQNPKELKERIVEADKQKDRGYNAGFSIPALSTYINPEEIATKP